MCSCEGNLADFAREVLIHKEAVSAHLKSLGFACRQQGENRRLPQLCHPAPCSVGHVCKVQARSDPLLHPEMEHSENPLASQSQS